MRFKALSLTIFICSCLLLSCKPFVYLGVIRSPYHHLEEAETALREERFDDAIDAYKKHIERRISLEDRPEWENPYFYYLFIGDVHLRQKQFAKALATYKFAEEKGVAGELVCDRIRMLARAYEEQGELRTAIALLQEYRAKEPLLIDDILDRLSKKLVEQEDLRKKTLLGK